MLGKTVGPIPVWAIIVFAAIGAALYYLHGLLP